MLNVEEATVCNVPSNIGNGDLDDQKLQLLVSNFPNLKTLKISTLYDYVASSYPSEEGLIDALASAPLLTKLHINRVLMTGLLAGTLHSMASLC